MNARTLSDRATTFFEKALVRLRGACGQWPPAGHGVGFDLVNERCDVGSVGLWRQMAPARELRQGELLRRRRLSEVRRVGAIHPRIGRSVLRDRICRKRMKSSGIRFREMFKC